MIHIRHPSDIQWDTVRAIAYDNEPVRLAPEILATVDHRQRDFLRLIATGVPCYGVTTGLGQLVDQRLTAADSRELSHNILRARAVAIGPPLDKPIVRSMMVIRLVNFLSGLDGVSAKLCRFLVDRLNDDFTPWVPTLGHGMAADATANTHAFQTFIGEGFVFGPDNQRRPAALALAERGIPAYIPAEKEGLALLNGVTVAPAYAIEAYRKLQQLLELANVIAAVSLEALAAPKDSIHPMVKQVSSEPGVRTIIDALQHYLTGSRISPVKLQSPISYRIIPQVHGALHDALQSLKQRTEATFSSFSGNPLMDINAASGGGQLLSVGVFHNQHLVNQAEHTAIALAHLAALSERRLHRLLNPVNTGLTAQLAGRPGLDAGLVVAHKATIDIMARLRIMAQPVSLATGDTSGGQEDYMSLAIPTIARLLDMERLTKAVLAYELLAGTTALDQRKQMPGETVRAVYNAVRQSVPPYDRDRSPGPDVETLLNMVDTPQFRSIISA
jgi:histidine ammonia-lyase